MYIKSLKCYILLIKLGLTDHSLTFYVFIFCRIGILARDLEAFAKHAKRTKVTTDDVILCARRNPFLGT